MDGYLLLLVRAGEYRKRLPTNVQNVNSCSPKPQGNARHDKLTPVFSMQWTVLGVVRELQLRLATKNSARSVLLVGRQPCSPESAKSWRLRVAWPLSRFWQAVWPGRKAQR